ncbi:jg5300 [Pararge aegeria aegeria]|uniref:Jg5300 protein n=1 Tax=Pararge aegeria aegeria TaxID=348720 RepID=A0A8S4R9A8_9NEOP|nr:jg5300 [Pararge aegeria aegeria]
MRIATGSPWFARNLVLHRDLDLPTIAQYMKTLSKSYFKIAVRHPNPIIATLCPRPQRRAQAATSEACPLGPRSNYYRQCVPTSSTHTRSQHSVYASEPLPRSRERSD